MIISLFVRSKFVIALCALIVINLLIGAFIGHGARFLTASVFDKSNWSSPMYGTWTWWVARGYFSNPMPPDIALLGSSQITSAVWATDAHELNVPVACVKHSRCSFLEGLINNKLGCKNTQVVNLALGGAVASDYYLISKALFTQKRKPKLVVIGISPRDFIDNQLTAASSTEPFRFFSQYVDTGKLNAIAFANPSDRVWAEFDWKFNRLPLRLLHELIANNLEVKNSYSKEKQPINQSLSPILNSSLKVSPNLWMVAPNMVELFYDNSAEYMKRYKDPDPPIYPIELTFFSEFLKTMKDMDIKVLVIGLPTQASNRALLPQTFWSKYRNQVQFLCDQNGAFWYDIIDSNQFQFSDYLDTVHLNARGGKKLLSLIANRITDEKQLSYVITKGSMLAARTK